MRLVNITNVEALVRGMMKNLNCTSSRTRNIILDFIREEGFTEAQVKLLMEAIETDYQEEDGIDIDDIIDRNDLVEICDATEGLESNFDDDSSDDDDDSSDNDE